MGSIPENVVIFGFSFAERLSDIKMDEMHQNLLARNIKLNEVVFSDWKDDEKFNVESNCTWVIAATRFMDENEIRNTIEFIIENNIEEEYLLSDYSGLYDRIL